MALSGKSGRSRLAIAATVLGVVSLLTFFQNCGQGFEPVKAVNTTEGSQNLSSYLPPPVGQFSVSQPSSQVTNLGTQLSIPLQITADANYSGTVQFSIDEHELKLLDPGLAISFSFSPKSLMLSPGKSGSSVLTVNVSTMAPSFTLSNFHVQAMDAANSSLVASVSVPLQVKAIYDVYLKGRVNAASAAPENWSVAAGSVVGFISHAEGLVFRINNMDSAVHIIHSSGGPIPHESTTTKYPGTNVVGLPVSPDGGKTAGGVYSNTVAGGSTMLTSQLYCHLHEGGAQSRTFQFNMPVVAQVISTGSGNPNATFTYINTNILQSRCVSCHSTANPSSGVNLSTYAGVSAVVNKGSASTSSLYQAVANGNMPLGGTMLSAAQIKDIMDWINDGGANN